MAFVTPYDIANRCCQHLGVPRIVTFSDASKPAQETGFVIDKVRRAELRRFVWSFATRRMVLRKQTPTTVRLAPAVYSASTTYNTGDIVQDANGFYWVSTIDNNTGQSLGLGGVNPAWIAYFGQTVCDTWSATPSYIPGDVVDLSNVYYICTTANQNQTPPNTTYWHPIQGMGANGLKTISPVGFDPAGVTQRNMFMLPANFLRMSAQDPKAPAVARLSMTGGILYNDWEIEQGMIASKVNAGPIVFRFVADTADIASMDDLFCEAWAARMARELCETLTQSRDKLDEIEAVYSKAIADAQQISAIEVGSTETDQPKQPMPATAGGGRQQQG